MGANKFKHTKGKWIATQNNVGVAVMVLEGKKITNICNFLILADSKIVLKEEIQANAKLTAAAPEMVKTLNAMKSELFNHVRNGKKIDAVQWHHRVSQVLESAI